MAEVHVTIKNIDASGNQVVFHNPGQHPLPASAGKSVTATATGAPAAEVSSSTLQCKEDSSGYNHSSMYLQSIEIGRCGARTIRPSRMVRDGIS
jgi:hypothetical protein